MKFYPKYLGDWKKKTAALSLLEKGAYNELLDYCYSTEEPLPCQIDRVWQICAARTTMEQRAVETVLKMFFRKTDSGYVNDRVIEELRKWNDKSEKSRRAAKIKWGQIPNETPEPKQPQ